MSGQLGTSSTGRTSLASRISPLAWQMVTATIAFSTLVALLATVFQLYVDFRRDMGQIDATFQQVQKSYLPTLANALWATNRHEVQVALDGLKQLPDVQYVVISEGATVWAEAGNLGKKGRTQIRDYQLTYRHRDQIVPIGTLRIVVDMEGVYQRILQQFWIILLSNALKTFVVAGFMMWLFHRLVTRHLRQIAGFAADFGTDNLNQEMALERPPSAKPDELDQVLAGFKLMQSNLQVALHALKQDIQARERADEDLRQLNVQLEQRVAERTLQIQEQARIIDEIHDAVLSTDLNGILTSWNRGAERLFGYTAGEALGRNASFLFPGTEAVIDPHRIPAAHEIEACIQRKGGELLYAHLSLSPLRTSEKEINGVVCYAIDITARKQAEALATHRAKELEASNNELEAFSFTVSHDLRAPLCTIDGFSQVLIEDYGSQLDHTGHEYLQRIRRAVQRMALLIDNLLRLARGSGTDMRHTHVDLSTLAMEIIASLERPATTSPARIHIKPGLKAYGDPGLLRIVLENLLENALKYTAKTPQPRIELGTVVQTGRTTYFIRDNGAGFDMAFSNKLFEAFQRLHREEDFPGTGIGLATVKRIIQRHGGKIWAESTVGAGAVFFFTLPRHEGIEVLQAQQATGS